MNEGINNVKIIAIGKGQYSADNSDWTDNNTIPIVNDPSPNDTWTNWGASQRDLFFLDTNRNYVEDFNITTWNYDAIYNTILGLLASDCTDPEACNYNPDATEDDGSCLALDECGECGGSNIASFLCINGDFVCNSEGCPLCDGEYIEIDGACYYQSDLDVLQQFIDNSGNSIDIGLDLDESGSVDPIELGSQSWSEGRITSLICEDKGLSGEIPQNIGNLTELRRLELGGNQLSGEIPESIGSLINLWRIRLFHNELSGSVPESICDIDEGLHWYAYWETLGSLLSYIYNNKLCPPYPDCLEYLVGYQDLSECQEYVADCETGYVNINGQCYFENEIALLQNFIINSDSIDMNLDILGNKNGLVEPLELGKQYWRRPKAVTDDMLPPPPELLEVRGRLFSFKASNLGLSGRIPDEIESLQYIYRFDISNNQLNGYIPESICEIEYYCDTCYKFGNNSFCPPYPDCGEGMITSEDGQDTSNCSILGCPDPVACNYNPDATEDDESCEHPEENYDCDGADIDECATDNGGCGDATYYSCTNNAGAAPTCVDIDECATDNGGCGDATCENNEGATPTCTELFLFNGLIPEDFSIHSIYPNPFNPITNITYGIPEYTNVQIIVYDLSGKQIETLINEFQTPGYHSVNWDADNLPSGVYLIRMDSGDFIQTQKVVLVN